MAKQYVGHTYFSKLAIDNTTPEERRLFARIGLLNELAFRDTQTYNLETITQQESEVVPVVADSVWVAIIRTCIDIEEDKDV